MNLRSKFATGWQILTWILPVIALSSACQNTQDHKVSILVDAAHGAPVEHGLAQLSATLRSREVPYEIIHDPATVKGKNLLVVGLANSTMFDARGKVDLIPTETEAYTITKVVEQGEATWLVTGFDDRGLQYALLDVAERIERSEDISAPLSELKEVNERPYVGTRAVSIYTMQRKYWESRFYDEAYWAKYMDMLVENRLNSLVVIFGYENAGFLAPCYPYFFNVAEYPQVHLPNMTSDEQARNLAALNRMIDMAHERGLEFKIAIWDHIYRGGVQAGGISTEDLATHNKDHLVSGLDADNLPDYTKAAFAKLVQLVPELDGFQLRMHNESGLKRGKEMEVFWAEMFGMIKEVAPDMQIDLRAKELPEAIINVAIEQGLNFTVTTKYWMEQMGLPFHPTHINRENQHDRRHGYADMLRYPRSHNIHWRLWSGGTQRILLWGDPDYVRRFAESTHLYDGQGFEINEPLATKMEAQPHTAEPFSLLNPPNAYYEYEFERYWHFYQVFGRVAYNPEISTQLWDWEFKKRLGEEVGPLAQKALHKASQILPRIIGACSPYGKFPTTRGWAEKQRYGDLPQYAAAEGSDIQQFASFDSEAQLLIDSGETAKRLPSTTSRWFLDAYHEVKAYVDQINALETRDLNKEGVSTLTDLNILAYLALYHSQRIPAAVSYKIYERTGDPHALDDAIRYEQMAMGAWRKIVGSAGEVYAPDLMMGVREVDRRGLIHRLTGHWKDELRYLGQGLEKLITERAALGEAPEQRISPRYISLEDQLHQPQFTIEHDRITHAPLRQDLRITVEVSSPHGIKWVRLRHRAVNQHLDYATLPMQRKDGTHLYNVEVPSSEIDDKFDFMYFFEVMDSKGKGQIYPDLDKETPYVILKFDRD